MVVRVQPACRFGAPCRVYGNGRCTNRDVHAYIQKNHAACRGGHLRCTGGLIAGKYNRTNQLLGIRVCHHNLACIRAVWVKSLGIMVDHGHQVEITAVGFKEINGEMHNHPIRTERGSFGSRA